MNTIRSFEQEARRLLEAIYPSSEAQEIVRQLLEEVLSCSRTRLLLLDKDTLLSPIQQERLRGYLLELEQGRPLQYILGYTFFAGARLQVSEGVLIPRPETEELISLILSSPGGRSHKRLLDIGTGSGCIAYALTANLEAPEAAFAIEVSSAAIPIASTNFEELHRLTGRQVTLWKKDLFELVEEATPPSTPFDLIVSNPPYIHPKEAEEMTPGVLLFEPHLALFAPEQAPIAYYIAIGELLRQGYLAPGGELWLELNPLYAEATRQALLERLPEGQAQAELISDLSGKVRFLHLTYLPQHAN